MERVTTPPEVVTNHTVKVRESLWRRMRMAAIARGCTVGDLAEKAFEEILAEVPRGRRKAEEGGR